MPADLTEAEFSKHVNTKFRVGLDAEAVDLELVQVKGYMKNPGDQEGMERFSIFFTGPAKPFLPQSTYALSHDAMGTFDLFLVPIKPDGEGSRYEAVFNYFKN
ncbi:MAG TPA: hypothetical protein VMS31_21800 [Pyrinomonadaceae bacterium]|nr:hypothetical protein [Pyrinomonadaceae bacterium]